MAKGFAKKLHNVAQPPGDRPPIDRAEVKALVEAIQAKTDLPSPSSEDDEGAEDHAPDLTKLDESLWYLCAAQTAGRFTAAQDLPREVLAGFPPMRGMTQLEALEHEFFVEVESSVAIDDIRFPLGISGRLRLRNLDLQTYEDYLLDHPEELAQERALAPAKVWEKVEATRQAQVEVMFKDYLRSKPPLKRLRLMKRDAKEY